MQAEAVRVPYANFGLVKLSDEVSDEQAIPLSDIAPTAYFGVKLAEIERGQSVAVFGAGPVGQFVVTFAFMLGAGRVFIIDHHRDRLDAAAALGAEAINFDEEDPVQTIRSLTGGIGVDRVVDAVGVDAESPHRGQHRQEIPAFEPGNAPSQALSWAVEVVRKAGQISIVGLYPENVNSFSIGKAMNKNISLRMGNCNHRAYLWELVSLVKSGRLDPHKVVSAKSTVAGAIEAYEEFDARRPGWLKVALFPAIDSSIQERPSHNGDTVLTART